MSAEAIWVLAERPSREHNAQLYSHETVLIQSLRTFTTQGLSKGEAVLLVLTPSHRQVFARHLTADGINVDALERAGQLLMVDAAELLASFMLEGMPDATFFSLRLRGLVARMRPSAGLRTVRVFGEMVDLLWKSNPPAAIRLEQLWNDLIEGLGLSLFCAYSTNHVHDSFPEVLCAPHSHIIASAIAETSNDAIIGHTLDQRIVYWNQGAERIYGYALDEVIGRPSAMLMPPGHNELAAVIERIRRGEQVPHYETRRMRKDGTAIDVSLVVSPVKTGDGELLGVSVVARDISERKRAEETLARLAAIVDSSEDAIIGKTLDTTIVSWNHGAEELYGYTATEAIGQPIGILFPPGAEDDARSVMEQIRAGKGMHYETKRQRKDGTIIDVCVTVSPIKTPAGEVSGASSVARDITERKQAEAARMQIARLEQSQAAHRLLLERVFETQEQERRRIARELHDEAGQLMASLLVGLRALDDSNTIDEAKVQANRLRGIAAQAIDEVGRLARGLHSSVLDDHGLGIALKRYVADYAKTHAIAVDLALHEPDTIDVPPAVQLAVFRIVQEALTNISRHSAATAISIRVARSATGLETTVADNGSGFDADAASVNPETHLGLQSMRERAAILGGTVSVRSGATGTTILVHIPLVHTGAIGAEESL